MAWLAVNKNGTELISSCELFRNGKYKQYKGYMWKWIEDNPVEYK